MHGELVLINTYFPKKLQKIIQTYDNQFCTVSMFCIHGRKNKKENLRHVCLSRLYSRNGQGSEQVCLQNEKKHC